MRETEELEESLIIAWVKLTGLLKNTRMTRGMIYNEAIVMMIAYNRFRQDGEGLVSFKEIVSQTQMLKSLVNRTIDSLVSKGFLERCDGVDKRTTFVKPVVKNLGPFLEVHNRSLALARSIIGVIGTEDAETFVKISSKIAEADPIRP